MQQKREHRLGGHLVTKMLNLMHMGGMQATVALQQGKSAPRRANPWGFHDMHGLVYEFTSTIWQPSCK